MSLSRTETPADARLERGQPLVDILVLLPGTRAPRKAQRGQEQRGAHEAAAGKAVIHGDLRGIRITGLRADCGGISAFGRDQAARVTSTVTCDNSSRRASRCL